MKRMKIPSERCAITLLEYKIWEIVAKSHTISWMEMNHVFFGSFHFILNDTFYSDWFTSCLLISIDRLKKFYENIASFYSFYNMVFSFIAFILCYILNWNCIFTFRLNKWIAMINDRRRSGGMEVIRIFMALKIPHLRLINH